MIAFFLAIFASLFIAPFIHAAAPSPNCTASLHNTCYYAWNDNIGWISHNSVDNPSTPVYGMNIDASTGDVSGWIWSDVAGWINLDPTGPYPAEGPAYSVQYDANTQQLSGWAQISGYGSSGWIKFSDTAPVAYGVTIADSGDFSGYAWSDTLGWIDFAPTGYAAVHYDSNLTPSVTGWAWNDTIGWISTIFTLHDVDYGVNMQDDGTITGYAWSEIGWIHYNPASGFPSAPSYSTRWDPATGQVSGWAQAVGMGQAYGNGWIKMRSSAPDTISYGVSIDRATGLWSGYAWNDVFGWIQYDHTYGAVYTNFPSSGPVAPVLINPIANVDTYTLFPNSALTPTMTWSAYSALDGTTQAQYQIQIDDDPDFSSTVVDESLASTGAAYAVGLGDLTYNVTYYWRVRVQSSNGEWSAWGTQGANGEDNSFRTPLHAPPLCNFSSNPATPIPNSPTQFTDQSITYGGSTMAQWSWDFGDGTTISGSDPQTDKNPSHTYTSPSQVTIKLDGVDSDGYTCTKSSDISVINVLPGFQRVIPR